MVRAGQGFGRGAGGSVEVVQAGRVWGWWGRRFFDAEFCDILFILSRWDCSVFGFCPLLGGVFGELY